MWPMRSGKVAVSYVTRSNCAGLAKLQQVGTPAVSCGEEAEPNTPLEYEIRFKIHVNLSVSRISCADNAHAGAHGTTVHAG